MSFRSKDLLRLVKDFGESLVLSISNVDTTYNPATGQVESSGPTNVPFIGYVYHTDVGVANSGSIVNGEKLCVIPYSEVTPNAPASDATISDATVTSVIARVEVIKNRGVPVCYICHLKE